MELPLQLDKRAAGRLLQDPEAHAYALLVAAGVILGEDAVADEDGQPYSENELDLLLKNESVNAHDECITKIVGLLMATSGDEFNEDPTHFHRMCSAISDGDPFGREDDGDPLTIPDIYWALYQVGLVTDEDEPLDEMSDRVTQFLAGLLEDEVEDVEALAEMLAAEGSTDPADAEPYYTRLLVFRRTQLAQQLLTMRCKPDWMTKIEPDLAGIMAALEHSD